MQTFPYASFLSVLLPSSIFWAIGPWQTLLILLVALALLVLPVIALIDLLRGNLSTREKLVWALLILLFNVLGSLAYFLFGKNKG